MGIFKKSKENKLDPYGFDSSLDLDMPDFGDSPKIKDDRKTATVKIAKAAVRGAKDTFKSPSFIRDMIKKSLPNGYGQAIAFYDDTSGSFKNIYNDAATEIKPLIGDIKRSTRKILPSVEQKMPRNMAQKIKSWSVDKSNFSSMSAEEQRNAALQMQMGEIFNFQTSAALAKDNEDRARATIKEGIDHSRHQVMSGQLDAMRISLQQLANYKVKVESNYQRKSLELQFRSYFLAQESFAEQRRYNQSTTETLIGILKNTGLPDFVKLKTSERLHEVLRNKFIDKINDSVIGKRAQFIKNVGSKLSGVAKEKIAGFAGNVRMGLDMAEAAAEASAMGGGSAGEAIGGFAGGQAANTLGGMLGKKLRKQIPKGGKIDKFGTKLEHGVLNVPQMLTEYAHSDKHESGMFSGLIRTIKDSILAANAADNTLEGDKAGSMQDPSHFSRGASKAVTEIIPGYLSRIYRELQIMRTGNSKIELTTYDFNTNKFADKSSVMKRILTDITGKSSLSEEDLKNKNKQIALLEKKKAKKPDEFKEEEQKQLEYLKASVTGTNYTKTKIEELLNELDPSGKSLTIEQRSILGKKMLADNLKNRSNDSKRLSAKGTYTGESGKHADVYSKLFSEHFKKNDSDEYKLAFSKKYGALGQFQNDPRSAIQNYLNTGNRDILEELGILDEGRDDINMEKVREHMLSDSSGLTQGIKRRNASRRKPKHYLHGGDVRETNPSLRGKRDTVPAMLDDGEYVLPRDTVEAVGKHKLDALKDATHSSSIQHFANGGRASKATSVLEAISKTLLRIERKIHEGISISGRNGTNGGRNSNGHWWNKSIKDTAGDIYDLGEKGIIGAGKMASNLLGKGSSVIGSGISAGLGFGKNILSGVTDRIRGFRDVYIKGEAVPRMLAWKLKAGKYRDQATGKIIKNWKDIQGTIVDEDGNIVFSPEEIKDAFVKSTVGEKLLTGLGVSLNFIKNLGQDLLGGLPGAFKAVTNFGTALIKKTWGLLSLPQDVYIEGRKDPVLLYRKMKDGLYYNKSGMKQIKHPGDINGEVVEFLDGEWKTILSLDEFNKGLLNSSGKVIRTGVNKLAHMAGVALGYGLKKLGQAKDLAGKAIGKAIGVGKSVLAGAGRFMTHGLTGLLDYEAKDGIKMSGSTTIIKLLTQIHDVLNTRLPAKKKHIIGDVDDNGIREGSLEDILRSKKDDKAKDSGNKKGGILGSVGSALGGLFGKKKDEEEKEKENGALDAAEGTIAGEAATSGIKGIWKGAKKLGGKGVLKLGGKALGLAGATYGAYSAYDNIKKGNYGEAALDTGLAAGGVAMTGLGGAALGIGGSILGGIGAALASPVLLPALAIAAAAGGGYLLYKHFKNKLDTFSTIRYAQYGFLPDDKDHIQAVFGLENKVIKYVTYNEGKATLEGSKLNVKNIIADFNVKLGSKKELSKFITWFNNRFKPVLLTHLTALNSVTPGKSLDGISKLKPEEKKRYLDIAKYPDGPYSETTSPFAEDKNFKSLPATSKIVSGLVDVANDEIMKELDKAKNGSKSGIFGKALDFLGKVTGIGAAFGAAKLVAGKLGLIDDKPLDKSKLNDISKKGADINLRSTGGAMSLSGVPLSLDKFASGKISALDAIRFKTYGLVDLALDKIRAISSLEKGISKQLVFSKDNVATWKGNIDSIILDYGPVFGIEGIENENAYRWIEWFNLRFLPIYLNYVTAICSASNKQNIESGLLVLKPQQVVDVATATYTTKGVWKIKASPWNDYVLNSDTSSVDSNMQILKDNAKKAVASEEKSSKKTDTGLKQQSTFDKVTSLVTDKAMSGIKAFGDATGLTKVGSAIGIGAYSAKETVSDAFVKGGNIINEVAKGTGGLIDSIPLPNGDGSWNALKATIMAAAKVVGVDDKMMATMAAIESGFRSTVKAGTSSATGLYQFISSTWKDMVKKYGSKYGITMDTSPTDPRANALMGAEFTKENIAALKGVVNRPLTDTDVYLAHFLGSGGAKKLLRAKPDEIAANLLPDAARANKTIFYNSNGTPRTIAETYAEINRRVRSKGKQFGLDSGNGISLASNTPDNKTTPNATTQNNNPIGKFPVSDQAPSPQASITSSDKPTKITQTDTTPVQHFADGGIVRDLANDITGFSSPRTRDIVAQAQFRKDLSAKTLSGIDKTLQSTLSVNQSQLEVLTKILGIMSSKTIKNASMGTSDANTDPTGASVSRINTGKAKSMPRAPVSMAKESYV